MTRRLLDPMPEAITRSQREASNPRGSVWVTANAGSGKTHVLTSRVLRLLLSGVKPEEILCLTYTKAAAAEMRGRLAERLAKWALADDRALRSDIETLEGIPPPDGLLLRARALFAHALETPGGLKIQTIHAFCESVLHRFPKEAQVPFDFTVIEDFERDAMLMEARERVIAAGLRGSGLALAVETLFGLLSDFQIETAIVEALGRQPILRKVLADLARAKREIHRLAGNPRGIDDVLDEIATGYSLTAADHAAVFALIPPDPGGEGFVDKLARIDPVRPDIDALYAAYLTQTCTARKTLLKKAVAGMIPDVAERLVAESLRLERLHEARMHAELVARSEALLDIIAAIAGRYEAQKRARSLLDFDDLIERMEALLTDEAQGAWVRYKLDARISHILVDEGQDTNPQQWDVIRALIDDFFHGESAADRPRTLFVVGDQKQSIFSFQGADPTEFVELGRQVLFSARAVKVEVTPVKLHYSFRTLPKVLEAVDKVFEQPELREGALESDFSHQTARRDAGGIVTLWPPIRDIGEDTDPDNWPTEPPPVQTQSAARQVAERIAREIRGWIDGKRPLGARGRPVTADDVLILVQVRSVLFHEIIRALIRQGVPTPGADRLAVTTHIGTLDLMALGDVLSNSAEDLQLAALLRSPLFEVSEDDLFAVAKPRRKDEHGNSESLWEAMKRSDVPSIASAYQQLRSWRSRLDFERPFNFYTDVLYRDGGLRKFRARFGSEIDDVITEFLELALAHEQLQQPSLQGFLAELRSREVIIKRDLAEGGAGVRVMTVHGAKGLEAPVVILADAASTEEGRDRRAIFMGTNPPFFVHASSKPMHVPATMEHRQEAEEAQRAEYWRKLYVAMTRAEDELYITGYLTKARDGAGSWYEAVAEGLREGSEVIVDADGTVLGMVYPRERPALPAASDATGPAGAAAALVLPPLPAYQLKPIVRPSSAFEPADAERVFATAAEAAVDPETARLEGIALHALLQHLGKVERGAWNEVARKALTQLLPGAPGRHGALAAKAISILLRPELRHLFGPDSRAEVPFLANLTRKGEPVMLAGRIDRMVVTATEVHVIDFKSDSAATMEPRDIPGAYRMQLGLYALVASQLFPGLEVRASILWTSLESLLELPRDALAGARSSFTMR
jgi:ATP-dependent helicase/nuclease subunit A